MKLFNSGYITRFFGELVKTLNISTKGIVNEYNQQWWDVDIQKLLHYSCFKYYS